jgi:RNA polymerase sigma-70 factor (ECF subfamily)
MTPDDRELVVRAQRGDTVAFEQLVHRYDRRVLSIAATYVSSSDEAKDIYQEVFIRVYRGLPKFESKSEFSTWLYRITTNVCLTHRSRRKRNRHISLDGEQSSEEDHPQSLGDTLTADTASDRQALDAEISVQVNEALDALSPQQKLVFTLRHYHGYKLREIAELMGCAEGTVKKYLFAATRRLREQLRDRF